MTPPSKNLNILDRPEINSLIFYPRPDFSPQPPIGVETLLFPAGDGTLIGGRFYLTKPEDPHLLFFHGNGEIASDYDEAAPMFNQLGLNFLVMDYRGYGKSQGTPTVGTLLQDALEIFDRVLQWCQEKGRRGLFFVMGRSLGSAPAIEIASQRQEKIAGLIVESGFAQTLPLLRLIGIPVEKLGLKEDDGFENYRKMASITKPTLIIHAQYDELIPLPQADTLLMHSGARKKELVIVPRAGHNDIMFCCGRGYFETIARFVNSLKRPDKGKRGQATL
jgi:uncharacterized protein